MLKRRFSFGDTMSSKEMSKKELEKKIKELDVCLEVEEAKRKRQTDDLNERERRITYLTACRNDLQEELDRRK